MKIVQRDSASIFISVNPLLSLFPSIIFSPIVSWHQAGHGRDLLWQKKKKTDSQSIAKQHWIPEKRKTNSGPFDVPILRRHRR